ncbi:MAG TPA: hypothetical protein VM686_04520 [Polyangiaceae bacterium]|nr:hypothetical protein [Polyangiaceae bacterium]
MPKVEGVPPGFGIPRYESLSIRATEIHKALGDDIAIKMRTTAVLEVRNPDGSIGYVVASNEVNLSPSQIASLRANEMPVIGPGHAEQTAINAAVSNGQEPLRIGVSRVICAECDGWIKGLGIIVD